MDSSSLEWLYHDPAGSGRNSAQGSGEVLALPRREELRVYRLLAGWAGRVRDLQGERSSVAVGSMVHGLPRGVQREWFEKHGMGS
jgi:hypothetical protein